MAALRMLGNAALTGGKLSCSVANDLVKFGALTFYHPPIQKELL
jgi:hypothetical protein